MDFGAVDWVSIGPSDAFVEGQPRWCDLDGRPATAIVCRVAGRLYAVEDRCGHLEQSMTGASVDPAGVLQCPHHGVCFRVDSGDVADSRGFRGVAPLRRLPVRERDGRAWLGDGPAVG